MVALRQANQVRSLRAKLKQDLRTGNVRLEQILATGADYLASAEVFALLVAVPKIGPVKAAQLPLSPASARPRPSPRSPSGNAPASSSCSAPSRGRACAPPAARASWGLARSPRRVIRLILPPAAIDLWTKVTTKEDIALVAGQLANLTRTVAEMETRVQDALAHGENQQERANQQRERTEIQQERIDLAARELAEVSARLQAAADALRASI